MTRVGRTQAISIRIEGSGPQKSSGNGGRRWGITESWLASRKPVGDISGWARTERVSDVQMGGEMKGGDGQWKSSSNPIYEFRHGWPLRLVYGEPLLLGRSSEAGRGAGRVQWNLLLPTKKITSFAGKDETRWPVRASEGEKYLPNGGPDVPNFF